MKTHRLLAGALALVLIAGLGSPAFGQVQEGASSEGTPNPGPGGLPTQVGQCVVIDFEGVGDFTPAGTIGDVTFSPSGIGLVDADAGGSGNIANEPSPDTVLFSITSNVITATLANPVNEISWNSATPFDPGEVRVFGAGNVLLATIVLPIQPPILPGDPNGMNFGTWTPGSHTEVGNVITSVEYVGVPDFITWDDLNYCVLVAVGGTMIPIDSTALLLAGAQMNAAWLIPVIVVAIGFAIVIARKF